MQLKEFKREYLELLLTFLWRQWSSLGVAGYRQEESNSVIDPEALLLLTATIARHDQRLFDEVLDWLEVNERFINVSRMRNILKVESFSSKEVIAAIAEKLSQKQKGVKWRNLSKTTIPAKATQPLFYLDENQRPLPVIGQSDIIFEKYGFLRNPVLNRGLSRTFIAGETSSLLLQLRALFGINSRAEVLLYLLVNGEGNIQKIADETYYSWRSTQEILFELSHTNLITYTKAKKGRVYYMDVTQFRQQLLKKPELRITWINWVPIFRSLEILWLKLNDSHFMESDILPQIVSLKSLMEKEILPRFIQSGFASILKNGNSHNDENFLEILLKNLQRILK